VMTKTSVILVLFCLSLVSGCWNSSEPEFARSPDNEQKRVVQGLELLDNPFYYYTSRSAGAGLKILHYKGERSVFGIDVEKNILCRDTEIIMERDLFYSGGVEKNDWQYGRDDGPVFERAWHQCVYNIEMAKSAHAFVGEDSNGYYYSGVDQGRIKPISKEFFIHIVDDWRRKGRLVDIDTPRKAR